MHPNPAFHWTDRAAMRAMVADIGFGALFASTPDGPRVAHVPVVWTGEDRIAFHLARGNALIRHLDRATALFSVIGPHGYVSPDWYGLADQVPTWNYLAVELEGHVRAVDRDALVAIVDRLTDAQEASLAPKAPWTRDKISPAQQSRLFDAIVGFELVVTAWRGTAKLGQNKPDEARAAVAAHAASAGRAGIARLMEQW